LKQKATDTIREHQRRYLKIWSFIPWTWDGNFKPSIIPERKRVTFIKKWSKLHNYF